MSQQDDQRRYREGHKELLKQRRAAWYVKNRDHALEYAQRYRQEHLDAEQARDARYLAEHREARRLSSAQWHRENPGESKALSAKWRAEHPEQKRAYSVTYNLKHPEKAQASTRRRRARKLSAAGTCALEDIEILRSILGTACQSPGPHEGPIALDHVIPLMRGGSNHPTNAQFLCRGCNSRKGARTRTDYRTKDQIRKIMQAFQLKLFG